MNKLKLLSLFAAVMFAASMWATDPMGAIDGLQGKNGSFRVWGWAIDPDDGNYKVTIHVYVYTSATETNAIKSFNAGAANISRPDLESMGYGTMHGFDFNLSVTDLNPGTYYVRVFALNNVSSQNNPALAYSGDVYVKGATIGSPYTVSYNANGGSGAPGSQKKAQDVTLKLSTTTPTRTGYTFSKWNTAQNGSGTNYNAGANYTANANATLYAQWMANTYKVTLDQQNGTGGSASVTATYGSAMPSATMPARTGYTFGGYYDQKNGAGTQYYNANGGSAKNWDKTAATTLYAKWTANQYTITFDRCGGTGGTESATATYDADLPAITLPTRTGHTFAGYFNESAGKGTKYYNADGTGAMKYNKAADTKVYANWTVNQYTITFDSKGGSAVEPITQNYGTAVIAPADPTREGYTFAGWEPALPETMPAENMTVVAQWNEIPVYAVALKEGTANADKVTIEPASAKENENVVVTPVEGYEIKAFKAYYTTGEGTYKITFSNPMFGSLKKTINSTTIPHTETFDVSADGATIKSITVESADADAIEATKKSNTVCEIKIKSAFSGWKKVSMTLNSGSMDAGINESISCQSNASTKTITATLNPETGAYSFAMPAHDVIIEATIAKIPAACGLVWLGVPEGGVVGTIGHEDEVVLPQLYATNQDFINALMGGSATVRLGSTDENVLKVNGFNNFQVIAAGECDVYAVHDADANFAYDSVAFHVTIKEAAIPLVANEGVTLRDYTEAGWWQMTAQVGMLVISISPDADALAGTYDVQDLNPQYNGIYDYTADQQNPVKINFVSGSFTVVVDAEAHTVAVTGEIVCSDGKTYAISLLYVQPEAKATVELNYPDAVLTDYTAEAEQFQIAGKSMENMTMASFVIYNNTIIGEYTEADLSPNYSYIYADGAAQTIYSATLKVEAFEGGYKLTGDVLCYNNTLYKVTLVVPATETGIEDVQLSGKAVKAFRDGQVVIIRDGKTYNVVGATVR